MKISGYAPDWAPPLWGPVPWCLGRLFIFARYSLRSEYCKNGL